MALSGALRFALLGNAMGSEGQRQSATWRLRACAGLLCALGMLAPAPLNAQTCTGSTCPVAPPPGGCAGPTCPVAPPPPGPGGCRGPLCSSTVVPRDEIVVSLPAPTGHQNSGGGTNIDIPLIDISNLDLQPASVDVGVTSGADPSSWDTIDVQNPNRYESCVSEEKKGQASKGSKPGLCETQRQQN